MIRVCKCGPAVKNRVSRQREEERDAEVAVSIYYCIKELNPLIPLPAGHCESKKQKQREGHGQTET